MSAAPSWTMIRLITAILVLARIAEAQNCPSLLKEAQTKWNTEAGIQNTGLDWNNPFLLRDALEGAFAIGSNRVAQFKNVCRGHKVYKQWLGLSYSYNGCLNPLALISNNGQQTNVSEYYAQTYFSTVIAFDFICGAGYPIYVNNADCMGENVFQNNKGQLNLIFANFWMQANSTDDIRNITPNKASLFCTEIDIAARGQYTQNIFATCGAQSQYFGCEYFRQSLSYFFTYCTSIDCSCSTAPCYQN